MMGMLFSATAAAAAGGSSSASGSSKSNLGWKMQMNKSCPASCDTLLTSQPGQCQLMVH
jgi:hypothetical protein